jgi:cytoskeletal protein CcmA (bactofilin family)
MVKASSLYIVVIISFVVALICFSLIAAAYFYRLSYQQKFRNDRLQNNLQSAISILLSESRSTLSGDEKIGLFNNDIDSVIISQQPWGVFDVGSARSYFQQDTLRKNFMLAKSVDSAKWSALYLIDEDRPLSVSGQTSIRGNVRIPKAGIRAAYVNNQAYKGDPKFVDGHIYNSERTVPALEDKRLAQLNAQLSGNPEALPFPVNDSLVENSFFEPTRHLKLDGSFTLKNMTLKGNIILYSDTTLFIDSTVTLRRVLIFAKSVVIANGFKGNCQIFASDSISVGKGAIFTYPSCIGLLPPSGQQIGSPPKVSMGEGARFDGIIFSYEKEKTPLPAIIYFGKGSRVTGQVYNTGIVALKDNIQINGSITCRKFLYQTDFTAYENFLINVRISAKALSPYYLTSDLMPMAKKRKNILLWLEGN